jgi:acyl carrier protein
MTIFEELKAIIVDQMGANPDEITMDTDIIKDLSCDSLDMVEMLMAVESKYGFEVDDSDVSDLATIGDVVKYIESRI